MGYLPLFRKMDYVRQYKRFINSHYLNGAIRITAGITLPAILPGLLQQFVCRHRPIIGACASANTEIRGHPSST